VSTDTSIQTSETALGRHATLVQGEVKLTLDNIPTQPFVSWRATLSGRHAVQTVMRDQFQIPETEYVQLGIEGIRLTFSLAPGPGPLCVTSALLREMQNKALGSK
jgi:hypothetical protein